MAEERKLSVAEVRSTISTSLAAAFGFVIALLWNQVVQGGLSAAGVSTTAPKDWAGWAYFVVTALILTLVMIVLIIVISRWGSKEPKKQETKA
jgi:heme/copper-type cytochrome/quinol oxidase subunit 2